MPMPLCHKCGKESNNLRVCPFCITDYRPQDLASRKSGGLFGTRDVMGALRHPSPAVKWGVLALLAGFIVLVYTRGREKGIPVGVVVAEVMPGAMTQLEAETLVRQTKETGKVETRGTSTVVTFAAATWPERRAGQLALAQRYARAVEMIDGAKRNIAFHEPSGAQYAQASAAGVMLVK